MKTQAEYEQSRNNGNTSEKAVQQRAYELFVARGQEPGHELEDWLRAEAEMKHGHHQKTHAQKT